MGLIYKTIKVSGNKGSKEVKTLYPENEEVILDKDALKLKLV